MVILEEVTETGGVHLMAHPLNVAVTAWAYRFPKPCTPSISNLHAFIQTGIPNAEKPPLLNLIQVRHIGKAVALLLPENELTRCSGPIHSDIR